MALSDSSYINSLLARVLLGARKPACNFMAAAIYSLGLRRAGVAQLVEHLICNQRVGGSSPSASSAKIFLSQGKIPKNRGRLGFCVAKNVKVSFVFANFAHAF